MITVIGAGLAGCEAAYQIAERGIPVRLIEMKPDRKSPAHVSDNFAELVCSNSLRSDETTNAAGLLKEEMRRLGSLSIRCADSCRIPAGGALAVNRDEFSNAVTAAITMHPLISVEHREVTDIDLYYQNPTDEVIIATGPLTSDALSASLVSLLGDSSFLSFFDAAAPIISADSIDMSIAFFASRYGKGEGTDYLNCPLSREEYIAFRNALCTAEEAEVHGFEDKNVFEGCMPIEVIARRGEDAMRFGPMKPVGLTDPKTGFRPYAVLQLRKENAEGAMYNLVGCQTHLKFPEQKRVFSLIPALREAEFLRYGVMHRNTFLNAPKLLDRYYRLSENPRISFAGQISGVEGYIESAASGLLVGIETARRALGEPPRDFPRSTAIGALALYVSDKTISNFQPMNINFGIIEGLAGNIKKKKDRNTVISERALEEITSVPAR